MEPLPEEPQSVTAQLLKMPAYQPLVAPEPVIRPLASAASRLVAGLMQAKDTVAILLLLSDGSLLFGIFFGFGVPGLVLYGLRWRQVRGRAGRGAIIAQAVLSLVHEVFWTRVYYGERTATEPLAHHEFLTTLYGLGVLCSVLQLLVTIIGATTRDSYDANLPEEQLGG